jgi:hypothetical protein
LFRFVDELKSCRLPHEVLFVDLACVKEGRQQPSTKTDQTQDCKAGDAILYDKEKNKRKTKDRDVRSIGEGISISNHSVAFGHAKCQ